VFRKKRGVAHKHDFFGEGGRERDGELIRGERKTMCIKGCNKKKKTPPLPEKRERKRIKK